MNTLEMLREYVEAEKEELAKLKEQLASVKEDIAHAANGGGLPSFSNMEIYLHEARQLETRIANKCGFIEGMRTVLRRIEKIKRGE